MSCLIKGPCPADNVGKFGYINFDDKWSWGQPSISAQYQRKEQFMKEHMRGRDGEGEME